MDKKRNRRSSHKEDQNQNSGEENQIEVAVKDIEDPSQEERKEVEESKKHRIIRTEGPEDEESKGPRKKPTRTSTISVTNI